MRPILPVLLATAVASGATPALAAPSHPAAEAQALALAKELIAIRSVAGPGNKTPEADAAITRALTAAGWKASEIETVPFRDTAYLIATWPGSDPALKPLVISGHLDVVEAKPADWQRDPFTPVVENGMLYGRGAIDMKFDAALATASLIELRREGYRPRRTVILQFSGDEETTMASSREIAKRLKNAEIVINIDGGGGKYDEKTAKPLFWNWEGAEKFYNDYTLEVTNPGGHSSAPRPDNAIVQLATALTRVGAYHFKPELSPVTKGYFENAAKFESDPAIAAAEKAFAANPADEGAIATLRAHPETVGKIGTTCVPTMIKGGHAENALPQRATANVNCRIFPGHSREEIRDELQRVVGMDVVKITDATGENAAPSPASPLRPDFLAAVTRALHAARGAVPIFPTQASGASDSQWYRNLGVDSYGASPMFIKDSDSYAHGLNERAPIDNIAPSVTYYLSLITDLSK